MKVMTILGTRPEIIKMSEIIKKLDKHTDHVFVHTGQNYDYELNGVFYEELGIREPDYFLAAAGNSLGETIARIMVEVEKVLLKEQPDAVVVLGDTNSALGAIIAKRLKIPTFHLEAGNRCFDDNVPEEINRRILDHIADVNLAYTENSRRYLLDEGVAKDRIFIMGSPMKEVLAVHLKNMDKPLPLKLNAQEYYLVSIHRDENVEIQANLDELVKTINTIAKSHNKKVVVSAHPRFKNKIDEQKVEFDRNVIISKPFGFFDYILLQINAKCVISDSGTISEESSILGFPAITIRNAIERPEAVDVGSIIMSGVDCASIMNCLEIVEAPDTIPVDYDVDNCSERVLKVILGYTGYVNKYVWHKV